MENRDRQPDDNRAGMTAALRFVVAGYLAYLGFGLVRDQLLGASSLPAALSWVCGAAFIAAGLGFGWYTWKRYRGRGGSDGGSDEV